MQKHFPKSISFLWPAMVLFIITLPLSGQEEIDDTKEKPQVEFKINGEDITKDDMIRSLSEANTCATGVCPTDTTSGWHMRRARLIQLIPERQFLEKANIKISDEVLKQRIEEIKKHPNPFSKSPPRMLSHVMVRDCISWNDLNLMVKTNLGLIKYAEQEFNKKWPTNEIWMAHAKGERITFEETYGKFRRISFSFAKWPKGAQSEAEALVLLKKTCVAAHEKILGGESFDSVSMALREGAKTIDESSPAFLAPFAFMGPKHLESIASLKMGQISKPLNSPFSWELLKRVPLLDQDIADALHQQFINKLITDLRKRIADETEVVKIDWMTDDKLHVINLE